MQNNREYFQVIRSAQKNLYDHGVRFESGLTDNEFARIESSCDFVVPPDLRWFLELALPVGGRFPNWRELDQSVLTRLSWPIEGICFDIRNRVFWWEEWGTRPADDEEAVTIAIQHMKEAPKLIPIFGHSYLPSEPTEVGNPVFSVHQADIIHRGSNLAEYLFWIFHDDDDDDKYPIFSHEYKTIRFWTDLARKNSI
jgi:hypothetical protein